jgi:WS/DGAT/MGAT family acyltransferase
MTASLSMIDFTFLAMEMPELPAHVGALLTFKPPAGRKGDFVQELLAQMRDRPLSPPFNYVLDRAKGGLPGWREAEEFDPYYHIRMLRLPRPGNRMQLCQEVTELHRRLMDRSRPLWEFYLIEGVRGGRFAIYIKLHHAIFDGASVLHAIENWLSEAADIPTGAIWSNTAAVPERDESALDKLSMALKSVPSSAAEAGRLLKRLPTIGPFLNRRWQEATGSRKGLMATPYSARTSPMDSANDSRRIFGYVDLPLPRIKALGKRHKASINDVMLTVCDMAILRYLEEQGTPLDEPLILSIAISLRKPGDTSVGGNNVTAALLRMGDLDADPASRLAFLRAAVKEARQELGSVPAEFASAYTLLVGAPALLGEKLGLLPRKMLPKLQNVVISNPFGLRQKKYLNGAELESLIPVSGLIGGASLNITLFSNVDVMHCGMIGLAESMPNIDRLGDLLKSEFLRLERMLD